MRLNPKLCAYFLDLGISDGKAVFVLKTNTAIRIKTSFVIRLNFFVIEKECHFTPIAYASGRMHIARNKTKMTAMRSTQPLPASFMPISPQLKQIGALGEIGAPQVEHWYI
jgi:hypothetical protein